MRQARKSSSSIPTVISERSDAVLALGKKLIRELKLGDTTDTLARWMAHYVAELIKDSERRSTKDRPGQLEKCFEAILALWQQMHVLPDGKRPFEGLEPVLRALESLGPSNPQRRYYPTARPPVNECEEGVESRKWLELADGLDYSARILIRQCLTNAAASAVDRSKEWVTIAERAARNDAELPIFKIVIGERDLSATSDPKDEQRKQLEDRVSKLRAFIRLATVVASNYERQLKGNKPRPKTTSGKSSAPPLAARLTRPEPVIVETNRKQRKRANSRINQLR